ncbi:DUF397 domain-containing protein [Streptomyces sp. NPDC056061]|uniref:DUF397 domain-containing protein n=1 Tax=Streptomyces sp. NPDC056061 TaxID=3345700 RepID=UPI0035E0E5DF
MSVEQMSGDTNGLNWFKSSHSGSDGGDCVEVATDRHTVHVRDSKNPHDGPVLHIARNPWTAFVAQTLTAE